jgi:hypothetical protein
VVDAIAPVQPTAGISFAPASPMRSFGPELPSEGPAQGALAGFPGIAHSGLNHAASNTPTAMPTMKTSTAMTVRNGVIIFSSSVMAASVARDRQRQKKEPAFRGRLDSFPRTGCQSRHHCDGDSDCQAATGSAASAIASRALPSQKVLGSQ